MPTTDELQNTLPFSMKSIWLEFIANLDTWGKVLTEDDIYPADKMSVSAFLKVTSPAALELYNTSKSQGKLNFFCLP